ncbi:MAG: carboxypeptidase-like regulatory domain-containing protein [Clostridiales bacterium]|nr:carboxypeptidase-like regulatory domain-containing protein [Clostridiales bacterium]
MANIYARCYIAGSGAPVAGASCSVSNSAGRTVYKRTNPAGAAVFPVSSGNYTVRCNCTPSYVLPSRARYNVSLCGGECRACDFACPLLASVENNNFVINDAAQSASISINNARINGA